MIMRNYLIYIILSLFLLTACNDWLDVEPKTQVKDDMMFQSQNGFQDALTACYIKMNSATLYGKNLTMTIVEYLAQHWSLSTNNHRNESLIRDFKYESAYAQNQFSMIYGELYNVIVQANLVLEHLQNEKDVIKSPQLAAVIEAEALAIRAFCHFDILRLFGAMPQNRTQSVNLGYAETVSTHAIPSYGFDDFTTLVLRDLDRAEALLKEHDPVMEYSFTALNYFMNADYNVDLQNPFLGYRQFRFNYYAVKAIKARIYRYMGDHENAYKQAIEIINAKTKSGDPISTLAGKTDFESKHYTLPSECLLALNNFQLGDIIKNLFTPLNLYLDKNRLEKDLFVGQSMAINNRAINIWNILNSDSQGRIKPTIRKYMQPESDPSALKQQIIPLIRLSEIYLIAIESSSDIAEINKLYLEYMMARSVDATPLTEANKMEEIIREYRREFFAEGQMFYTYKRLGTTKLLWKKDREVSEKDYLVPLPTSEIKSNH